MLPGDSRPVRRTSSWIIVPGAVLVLTAIGVVLPLRDGPTAFLAGTAPAIHAACLLLLPLGVARLDATLAGLVAAAVLAGFVAYPTAPARQLVQGDGSLRIMTWNLHGEEVAGVGLPGALARWSPDVLVLQEAETDAVMDGALPPGMEALPFPEAGTPPGMLLASNLPILDSGEIRMPATAWDRARAFWMRLDAAPHPVTVVAVHLAVPIHPSSLPCPYCPTLRDAQVAAVAQFIRARMEAGEVVILAGDLNLNEREVAYHDLAFLTDAARGPTWRHQERA
ncbi:MAG TPA: endonuclease/exonuclease/phosphatase family protein [Candidatus Limnocylindria bacterium]|nr:endonuclease/exonuclease/phosphatase family protein [Candidatus Limnocylindria bacterium]